MIINLRTTYLKPVYLKGEVVDSIPWKPFYQDPLFNGLCIEFDWFSEDYQSFTILCLERGISVRLIDRALNINRVYQHTDYILPRDSRQSLTQWDTTKLPLKELTGWRRDNNSYLSDLRKNQALYKELSEMKLRLQDILKSSDRLLGQLQVIIDTYPERDFSTNTREDLARTFATLFEMDLPQGTYECERTIIQGLSYLAYGIEPSLSHNELLSYNTVSDQIEYARTSEA